MKDKANFQPAIIPVAYALLIVGRAHGGKDTGRDWSLFTLIASICLYSIVFTTEPEPGPRSGATLCCLIFTASEHILLRNRGPEIKQLGQKKPTSAMSSWERLKMSGNLILSPRHIGFSSQVTSPHIRLTPPNVTRPQFIISGLKSMCFYGLIYDLTCLMCHTFPMYSKGGLPFSECGWLLRMTIWLQILGIISIMSMLYLGASLVAVSLGISSPQDWPPYFGSFQDAYTVRNVWGRVWHQMLRKSLTAHGNIAADILRLPKCTFTTYFKLYVAFLGSGILHFAGDYMCLRSLEGGSLNFFLLQAVAITFEDAIIGLAKRAGVTASSPLTKTVGFCWVFAWVSLCVPYWLEPVYQAGIFSAKSPDVSLVQYLWKGQWKVSKNLFM